MPLNDPNRILGAILKWAMVVLLCKVTIHILYNYQGYFPPNFESDFLRGRESYFFGSYQVAFYAHILASPITLLTGTILMSRRFRERYPSETSDDRQMARPDRACAGGSKRPLDGHPRVHRSDRRHRVCAVIHRNRILRSPWLATSCIAQVHRASAVDDALLFVVMLGDSFTTHGRFLYHYPSRTQVDLSTRRLAELDTTASWLRSIRKKSVFFPIVFGASQAVVDIVDTFPKPKQTLLNLPSNSTPNVVSCYSTQKACMKTRNFSSSLKLSSLLIQPYNCRRIVL